jgi:hypothetical protein
MARIYAQQTNKTYLDRRSEDVGGAEYSARAATLISQDSLNIGAGFLSKPADDISQRR